jgi:hypothetical protein
MKNVTAALLLWFAVAGCGNQPTVEESKEQESSSERLWRFRKEAASKVTDEAEKTTVGYRRTLNVKIRDSDPNTSQWSAEAMVEYINRIGGVETTNLPMRFGQLSGEIYCHLDERKIFDRNMEEWRKSVNGSRSPE